MSGLVERHLASGTDPKLSATGGPRRRTLQSGFSLLARGEPKIWLTGGTLVICLAMIVGLLGLIVINGLATFWPGPLDWLVLAADGGMDIGEPQAIEERAVSGSDQPAQEKISRFYRTANFDITGRHYRWFEPHELQADGIVRPQWGLVIERLSWGRMYALPSRLIIPITDISQSEQYQAIQATVSLVNELSVDLEALAGEITPDADSTDAAATITQMTAALTKNLVQTRSQVLSQAVTAYQPQGGKLLIKSMDAESWSLLPSSDNLDTNTLLSDVRLVWDEPQQILDQVQHVIAERSYDRQRIKRSMHEISRLDRSLSDARVQVRQVELDSGLSLLDRADLVGPLVERLLVLEQLQQRLAKSAAVADSSFGDNATANAWQKLVQLHKQRNLEPALTAARQELDQWEQQFANLPASVGTAMLNYRRAWREVLEAKQPLEQQIQSLRERSAGYEMLVSLPSEAKAIQFSEEDDARASQGELTASAVALLANEGIAVSAGAVPLQALNDRVQMFQLADPASGQRVMWRITPGATSGSAANAKWWLSPQRSVACEEIVRVVPVNQLGVGGKLQVYGARWLEFLWEDPREANTEGGVFPAIWGTIVMTLIMTLAVVPFGVIAALYLREYTRSGPIVSLVRISINNLAGVPSIVYGVFGLAFFCYSIGAFIDGGPKNAEFGTLPTSTWYGLLAATVCTGVVAFFMSLLGSGPEHLRSSLARWLSRVAPWLWLCSLLGVGALVFYSPFFDGFYAARLPAPTFGKEGLLWAAFTLALLTLPVVIVATEEALAAVPNSLREGSLACGASKWQTIYRIVLPHARPGILTGAILAMARGIGEVAPLMLVGALPVAPELPLDGEFPYLHGSRSFMHLGYQIYWLGFQSQNSEASKPLVFTCTLLLILIVIALNLSAILLRARLRRRFLGNQF